MSSHTSRIITFHLLFMYRNLGRTSVHKSANRLYATAIIKKSDVTTPIYTKTDEEYKLSRKATVETIENLLNIKALDALHLVGGNKVFRQVTKALLKKNHALLLQKNINLSTLQKYPELLTIVDVDNKIKEIEKLPYDINVVAPLLLLDYNNLMKFKNSELAANRKDSKINILSSLLKITPQKACECLAQKPFLISLPSSKITTNIKLLLYYGVKSDDVCSDLWVLRYSDQLIESRLSIAQQRNVDTMKTWMVRAQHDTFQTYIQRRSDNKSILGNSSLAEYLSERLECGVAVANYLILKQPALQNKSLKKLKELIDFLFSQGFKPQHICRVPKILVHSVETTRKRLKQLEEKGIQIDSLSMLTKSQNQFTQYYEALVKSKNKPKS